MEEWLRAKMLASAGIAAIAGDHVDWGLRPAGDQMPGIELFVISDVPERRMAGNPTWHDARVQANCWGVTPGEAIRLRRAVAAFAEGLRATVDGKKYRVFVIDADGRTEPDAGRIAHRAQVDLRISYQV